MTWCLSIVSSAIALSVFIPHYKSIEATQPCSPKKRTLKIIYITPSFAITSLFSLFFPRSAALFAVIRSVVESQAIYAYVALLIDRLGGFDKAVDSIMQIHTEGKFLATPPLCCCCRPCCPVIPMSRSLLVMCRRFAMQAVYAIPALSYLHLWVQLEKANDVSSSYDNVIIAIQVIC